MKKEVQMLLFQTSLEIKFYFQHFIKIRFYFLGKDWGARAPGPSPCYGTGVNILLNNVSFEKKPYKDDDFMFYAINEIF